MSLQNYHLGDKVEVLVLGAWTPGVVTNPQTAIMPLIVTLDSGVNWPVQDAATIRHVASLIDAADAIFSVGDAVAVRGTGGLRWTGTITSVTSARVRVALDELDASLAVPLEMIAPR